MAKFTKLNIGDSVASSGGRVFKKLSTVTIPTEQLPAPYAVTIDGNTLTWGDYSALATSFDILVDGVAKATVSAPTNSFDLSTLGLASGTYSISVVSKAEGYLDSEPSEAVTYTVGGDELAGTWVFNNSISMPSSYIYDTYSFWLFNFVGTWLGDTTNFYGLRVGKVGGASYNSVDFCTDIDDNDWSYFWRSDVGFLSISKTINITSKLSEVTDSSTLLTWLKANATKQ